MSDNKNPLPPPITDREGTYNYRLKYKSNEGPYYYIKEYESDMEWYKKYIIISVIILIIFIALIITGFITSGVIFIVIGFIFGILSGLVLWYFITEYKNSKENRDESIQDAKYKIEDEIKKEIGQEEKKKKEAEIEKTLIYNANKEKEEYIAKLTIEKRKELTDEIKRNQTEILQIITEGNKKNSNIEEISRNIIKYMNENQFSDYFFKNYKSDYLDPLIEGNDIYKDIISGIKSEIQYYNKLGLVSKWSYLDPRPPTKTDDSSDNDWSHEAMRYPTTR